MSTICFIQEYWKFCKELEKNSLPFCATKLPYKKYKKSDSFRKTTALIDIKAHMPHS